MSSHKIKVGLTHDFLNKELNFYVPGPGLKLLDGIPNIEYDFLPEGGPEILPDQIAGMNAVVTLVPRWTANSIAGVVSNQLVLIVRAGTGYDNLDVPSLTEAGIMLCNTPEGPRRSVAVGIITMMLALSTRLIIKDRQTREGRGWQELYLYHLTEGLTGKTLGSLGVGNIGRELFRLAKPFDMRHIGCDPYVTPEAVADVEVRLVVLDTLLRESDFLAINAPFTKENYHIIGAEELVKMKRTAYLINTARGSIVDEVALTKALQEGTIGGAALDVFEKEPVSPGNPLLKLDNVVLCPHAIAETVETECGVWSGCCRRIAQLACGKAPDSLVNREVLENPKLRAKLRVLHDD